MSQTGPRAAASARRRRALLDAALELFPKTGVGNCRLEDLLERSGASVGSFYHHFGGKPELAAALYLKFLDDSHRDFLAELSRHRTARAGIRGVVGHHLRWVAEDPQRAAYLFTCLEPEVAAVCCEREAELTAAFHAQCFGWLNRHAAEGRLRKLAPLEYLALWMGPANVMSRTWILNVEKHWAWMTEDQLQPEALIAAEKNLADAAWAALRSRA